jgi:hypothetical protein
MRLTRALVASGIVFAAVRPAEGQSKQPVGLQLSALSTGIVAGGGTINGFGVEPQIRFNGKYFAGVGKLSIGLGGQYSKHTSSNNVGITISGIFLEPRLSLAKLSGEKFGPYLAARVAVLRQSNDVASSSSGTAFGGGGGFNYAVGERVNLDAGVHVLLQNFGESKTTAGRSFINGSMTTYAAKIGVTVGVP